MPTLTAKEFRRSWQSHSEKLAGLVAYQAAFVEEAVMVDATTLRERTKIVGQRKMDAIYVDFNGDGVVTPATITADEATTLLDGVEAAVLHASATLAPMTQEVVGAANLVAPTIAASLEEYLASVGQERAIEVLRGLVMRLPYISAAEWTAAIEANEVPQLLRLD